jgi:hypothetical protein
MANTVTPIDALQADIPDLVRTLMTARAILSVLLSVFLSSCQSAMSIKKVQVLAPPLGNKSNPLSIPLHWQATWETPHFEPIYMWVNKGSSRIFFEFEADYHSLGDNIQTLQFGSTTHKSKIVSVTLWPPETFETAK